MVSLSSTETEADEDCEAPSLNVTSAKQQSECDPSTLILQNNVILLNIVI